MESEDVPARMRVVTTDRQDSSGDLEQLVGAVEAIARELIEHRRSHQVLEQHHALLLAVIDGTPDFVFVKDLENRYLFVNPALARAFNRRIDEIVGLSVGDLYGHEVETRFAARDAELMRSGETRTFEERVTIKGEERILFVTTGPYRDRAGRLAGMFGVARDITVTKRADEEKAALVHDLEDALAARDEFLAIASHELKTPIAALRLQVENSIRVARSNPKGGECPPWMLERLDATERQMRRLCRQVNNLLDMAQLRAGKMLFELEHVDMVGVTKEVLTRHADEVAEAGCELIFEAPPSATGEWDRLRVEQVVTNLLTNAIKYGRGKPVHLRLEETEREVMLTVRDHGIGISARDRERLFTRFSRASNVGRTPGRGLGLWIVAQIVEAHGGEITVESEVGEGTTFTVRLPRCL